MKRIIELRVLANDHVQFEGDTILCANSAGYGVNMYVSVEEDEGSGIYTDLILFKSDDVIPHEDTDDAWAHVKSIDGLHLYRRYAEEGK